MKSPLSYRSGLPLLLPGLVLLVSAVGCVSSWFSNDTDSPQAVQTRRDAIRDVLESEDRPKIIADIASPRGLTLSRLENIALVTSLPGTGGKVSASQPREKLLTTMRRFEASQPNTLLDDSRTAMVIASVVTPPAAQRGSELDTSILISSHSEGTNLQGGWLMKTSLMEMSRLGGQVREGFEAAVAEGHIVTLAQITGSEDPKDKLKGVVVGGTRLLKQRSLGISLDSNFADAITMKAILPAINRRFTAFNGRSKTGIAKPENDSLVSLAIPARYRLDPFHFVNVVLHTGFNETAEQKTARKQLLSQQLMEPTTAKKACWQLEAIGEESLSILAQGLQSSDPEIRFYSAHSMAYLDDRRAIRPLMELCRQEPAFRAMCLNALAIHEDYEAEDALSELLHSADPEVRYGAVRAIRERNDRDPQVVGQQIGEIGQLLEIPSNGPPLVVVSLSKVPEIVIFGYNPQVIIPDFLYASQRMLINSEPSGSITVNHFAPNEEDRVIRADSDLRSVLQAIGEAGGNYGDWVSFLRQCSEKGYLVEPVAINPIPTAGRTYHREQASGLEPGEKRLEETIVYPDRSSEDSIEDDDRTQAEADSKSLSDSAAKKQTDALTKHDSESVGWFNPLSWWSN